jgi:hypothetical protein
MPKTHLESEYIPHQLMWSIVGEQSKIANEREREGWSKPALVAMMFAFHTLEAYMNFVGERLAPDIWKDERNSFRNEPYRGWDGKLRKVMDLVGLPMMPGSRPLKTILELKELRDLIAHGKPEKSTGDVLHHRDAEAPYPTFTLHSMFTPKEKMTTAVHDVEQFIEQIHSLAAPKVNDVWFGEKALQGPLWYSTRATTH